MLEVSDVGAADVCLGKRKIEKYRRIEQTHCHVVENSRNSIGISWICAKQLLENHPMSFYLRVSKPEGGLKQLELESRQIVKNCCETIGILYRY